MADSIQCLGDGRFVLDCPYDVAFPAVQDALNDCSVKVTECSPQQGLLRGKCRYGINVFGITVTAVFYESAGQIRLELTASFADAIDIFGACKQKIDQVSDR